MRLGRSRQATAASAQHVAHDRAQEAGQHAPQHATDGSAESKAMILFVCTGNLCRSPYMELVFAAAAAERGIADRVAVRSAGVGTVDGALIAEPMGRLLAEQSIGSDEFRSTRLTRDLVAPATMIITADRTHRAPVGRSHPRATKRIFTLRQAARLLQSEPDDHWRSTSRPGVAGLVEQLGRARGRSGPATEDDDIVDPWQREESVYRQSVEQMRPALDIMINQVAAALS